MVIIIYKRFFFCFLFSWNRLAPFYYKDSDAALIVYDVLNDHSLHTAKIWINELRKKVCSVENRIVSCLQYSM